MNLLWIATKQFQKGEGPLGLTSVMASMRYRILLPASELGKRGHQIAIASALENTMPPNMPEGMDADAIILTKGFHEVIEILAAAARTRGIKVIFDICDNHFMHAESRYDAIINLSDTVTCNTEAMAEVIKQHTDKPCYVIGDPYEIARRPAAFNPGNPLKLLWFGHPINFDGLTEAVPVLKEAAKTHPLMLTVVSQSFVGCDAFAFTQRIAKKLAGIVTVRFMLWSPVNQQQAFADADLVIIPPLSAARREAREVKSSNRIVDSLMAGRMVVADSIPSYEPFRKWAWLGTDMAEGIRWVLEHKAEIPARITAAQDYIEQHYSPEVIARRWENVLESAIAAGRPRKAQSGLRG